MHALIPHSNTRVGISCITLCESSWLLAIAEKRMPLHSHVRAKQALVCNCDHQNCLVALVQERAGACRWGQLDNQCSAIYF